MCHLTTAATSAALACLTVSTLHAQRPTDATRAEQAVIASERALNGAIAEGDVGAFRKLFTGGFGIDAMGVMSMDDYAKMLAGTRIDAWSVEDPKVEWITGDVALVAYRWRGRGTMHGQPLPTPTWVSSIWVRQKDGSWRCRFHQETASAPEPDAGMHHH